MAEVRAFGALRFTPKAGKIDGLVCPPYDIISEEQRQAYLAENPHNIIRLELPKEGDDPYKTAGDTFGQWMNDGILACDDEPGIYIYEEEFTAYGQSRKVKGFVCRVRLEEFSKGVVLPHEETLSKAKTDRFNLMKATGCNFSSIYSLYFDSDKAIYPNIDAMSAGAPDVEFPDGDGVIHRVWRVTDMAALEPVLKAFADCKLYIADGHHRYETALNYRNHLREQGVVTDENHPANFVMMTLVNMEHDGLVVFPTHRIVRGLTDFSLEAVMEGCRPYFDLIECTLLEAKVGLQQKMQAGKTAFALYTGGGKAIVMTLHDRDIMDELLEGSDVYRQLDVCVLHTLVLERLMGIDKENMANQKNLIYTRDPDEAVAAVDKGEANCAFLINATRVSEIAAVAGAGEKMPQKSTYFYPKLITGHVMNKIL